MAGGFQLNADFRFSARVADFGYDDVSELHADLLQSLLTYLGDKYKVQSVSIAAGGQLVTVDCNTVGQGG